ncbi:uncharacterized protein DUF4251 [Mucilaginibacter yixingensis]|uniref:Uncharacterized protein DUF4251 n=1 Tax=Mucilaginibacter yixingensis TaxID=1295612 RepID=A0A2T5JA69_9SPHI|nr:DUF4251 domain-containing protein [Mucilaginibacter yixingensis]PTQ96971.1 uncharacterized protein DUF4251 [Mucilaginibacter yixingensis]
MKILKALFVVLAITAGMNVAHAQNKKKAYSEQENIIMRALDMKNYTFNAQSANPMRGTTINLTGINDLRIKKDSIIAYLPYYGRAYMGVAYNPTESPLQFTSTKFTYSSVTKKNDNREITIKLQDSKEIRQIIISTSLNGYATVTVTSNNRDPITFYGTLEETKADKK